MSATQRHPAPSLRAWAAFGLLLVTSMLLLSGCMIGAVLPSVGWLAAGIGAAIALAACSSGGSSSSGADASAVLSITGGSAYENESAVEFTVTLSQALTVDATVEYSTSDGTAEAGTHYEDTAGQLTFPANNTSPLIVSIPILAGADDDVFNAARTLTLTLANPSAEGVTVELEVASAIGKIRNDEATLNLDLTGTSADAFRTFINGASNSRLGQSLAGADINGDGKSDLVIGAPDFAANVGRAYVINGSDSLPASTNLTNPGTAAFLIENGNSANVLNLGRSVAAAPAQEGKAYVLVGAPNGLHPGGTFNGSATGSSFVIFDDNSSIGDGSISVGIATNEADVILFEDGALQLGLVSGQTVAQAGDVNGDGTQDFIIGDPRGNSANAKGQVHVISGAAHPSGDVDVFGTFTGIRVRTTNINGSELGTALAGNCDFNGDTYADIIIGDPEAGPTSTGMVHIIFGGPSVFLTPNDIDVNGTDPLVEVTLTGADTTHKFGSSVACAGDLNGDGMDEILIGAQGYGNYLGTAYVVYGTDTPIDLNASGLSASLGFRIDADVFLDPGDNFGNAVAGGMDLNLDGIPDLAVGWPIPTATVPIAGVFVIFGAADLAGGTGTFDLFPEESGRVVQINAQSTDDNDLSFAAMSLANAGDVDGDGVTDLLVGFPDADGFTTSDGRVYVIFGAGF